MWFGGERSEARSRPAGGKLCRGSVFHCTMRAQIMALQPIGRAIGPCLGNVLEFFPTKQFVRRAPVERLHLAVLSGAAGVDVERV